MIIQRTAPLGILAILAASPLPAAEYPSEDHAGADLVLSHGDTIWGEHVNIGRFVVPEGAVVLVHRYYPDIPGSGRLDVFAREIVIAGKLDAEGAGYTGGGGQRALGSRGQPGFSEDGQDGEQGLPRYLDYPVGPFWPNRGDGPFGGNPSRFEPVLRHGGYMAPNANGDTTTNTLVLMGSGGAGGYASPPADTNPESCMPPSRGGNGGHGGGPGGGAVRLFAEESLTVSGTVYTVGAFGGGGGLGQVGGSLYTQGKCFYWGGDGGDGGSGDVFNNGIGNAGSSAGGGVVLSCDGPPGSLTITGIVDVRSSEWRIQGRPTDGIRTGATVKLFYRGSMEKEGATLLAGRIHERNLEEEPLSAVEVLLGYIRPDQLGFDTNHDAIVDAGDLL